MADGRRRPRRDHGQPGRRRDEGHANDRPRDAGRRDGPRPAGGRRGFGFRGDSGQDVRGGRRRDDAGRPPDERRGGESEDRRPGGRRWNRPSDQGDQPGRPRERPRRDHDGWRAPPAAGAGPADRPAREGQRPLPPFRGPREGRRSGPTPQRFDRGEPGRRPPRPPFGRRPPVPNADLLHPEEELIAGRRPVEEAFVAGREARRLLVVPQRRQALERIVLHAANLRIPIVEVEGGTLTALAGFDGHQGVAVAVTRRRSATLDEILARAVERARPPFVLALDSLEDPQNVGTLLRTAEAAGVDGVVFPTRRQAPLSPAAVKASAGAVEHLLLAPVDDLAETLADLHIRGLRIAGAAMDAPLTAREADLRGPLAIVVGSEGQGLGPAVRRRCDVLVRIPLHGRIESLNAAVAGSILLYEADAQRQVASAPETSASDAAEPASDAGSGPAKPPRKRGVRASAERPPEPGENADSGLLPGGPEPDPEP